MITGRRHRVVAVLVRDGVYPFELGIPARIFGAADERYEVVLCSVAVGPAAGSPRSAPGFRAGRGGPAGRASGHDALGMRAAVPSLVSAKVANRAARRCVVIRCVST
nr:hypothetical protein [Nakamurella multipartita]